EVRLKHTLEVRGGDSQTLKLSPALPALWTGILYDDAALAEAESFSASFTFDEMQALRPELAKLALRATFRKKPLAEAAQRVLEIARGGLARRKRLSPDGHDEGVHLGSLSKLVERGRCPADDLLDGLPAGGDTLGAEIVRRTKL